MTSARKKYSIFLSQKMHHTDWARLGKLMGSKGKADVKMVILTSYKDKSF